MSHAKKLMMVNVKKFEERDCLLYCTSLSKLQKASQSQIRKLYYVRMGNYNKNQHDNNYNDYIFLGEKK